jgi:hypothetical protein
VQLPVKGCIVFRAPLAAVTLLVSLVAAFDPCCAGAPRLPATSEASGFVDLLAMISGRCKVLVVAGRTFGCRTVAYAHGSNGRVNFAVAIDDPADSSHVISFSGENGKRSDDNSFELPIDRMLLNSKDRPKIGGLLVPAEERSTGMCRQTGNFAARKVSDITCFATDGEGRRYELLFVSDGSPVSVRRIRQSAPSIQDPFK